MLANGSFFYAFLRRHKIKRRTESFSYLDINYPMKHFRLIALLCLLFGSYYSFGQNTATLFGKVTDEKGKAIEWVHVAIKGQAGGKTSDQRGEYVLTMPSDTSLTISFSFIGFKTTTHSIKLTKGEKRRLDVMLMQTATVLPTAEVRDERTPAGNISKINPKAAQLLPTVSGGIEDLIKTMPGVSSNNELSSQYTVRGGNFDENLVYVNGIEIYRPFLIRSGQQEGMSFLNSAMVSGITFSAGGFAAEYGDKLSSVLDITYKKPAENGGAVSLSLLGAALNAEGLSRNGRFTYLLGTRYKTTQYILNALETKGEYRPDFIDVQSLLTYKLNHRWDVSLLAYYARNKYKLIPQTRQTDFGTLKEAYRLTIYFDGQEVDRFETGMGALTLSYKPNNNVDLKLIASAYQTAETETYDIEGQYWIGKLETSLGSEQFGEVLQSQGVGTFIDHARNAFDATVVNLEHKGTRALTHSVLKWGARYQLQHISDRMSEWELLDSAGFTLPRPPEVPGLPNPVKPDLVLNQVAKAKHDFNTHSLNAFVQHAWNYTSLKNTSWTFNAGLRANYWSYANEWTLSPRVSATMKPDWKQNVTFRWAAGVYQQAPYYREMRLFDGSLFENPRSQRSYQLIAAADYQFQAWNRPFVFTSELYFKYFDRLVPYEIDNVRIRYYADQQSKGYATGLDLKVNGEFVKGVESWASMSLMKTEEDITGDFYTYFTNTDGERITLTSSNQTIADTVTVFPGLLPRPADQRLQFAIFFQDYIPRYPTFRVHLKLLFGSRLPFGEAGTGRYMQTRRMPEYRRVDIGFSKQLLGEDRTPSKSAMIRQIKNMWISLEVFNLLQISNTVSYLWVKDVNNIQYGVPNYLTPRQLNLKLVMEF